ncbi:MAG: indolepyruvate oxidoreductase subunit beta [Clostridia bacterium]|nr:indolepyruvate oxidoreductase subunit beta [Clostridia bacterium]
MKMDVVIIGVGGQGTLLASRILGALADLKGLDVKVSEVHGMSQRGGSVITYVRVGSDIHSPMVDLGGADVVLAFEQVEALRALPYLKRGGVMIVGDQKINPLSVITGQAAYPKGALDALRQQCRVLSLDALSIAREAGEVRSVNLVLLGVLCAYLGEDPELWHEAVARVVKSAFLEVNLKAFDAGRRHYEESEERNG